MESLSIFTKLINPPPSYLPRFRVIFFFFSVCFNAYKNIQAMPRNQLSVQYVQVVWADKDHFRQWKTRLHDYCLLEGYRGLTMNRNTKTNKCHISFKQPFKINVLRTEIPSSEWNTLEQCHRPKKSSKRWRQTRICPKKFKEHYVEASTLMQDSYHFWVKMTQQTTVTITWKTMVRTANGCWSVGV